jgi:multicomponent Na+:H+ antiporter subunit E
VRIVRQLVLFLLLLAFWQGLSGRLDPLFFAMGVVSSAAITLLSTSLLEATIGPAATHPRVRLIQLVPYATWMLGRMFVSALQVARIVLDPRVPPEPGIARFRTQLTSPAARSMLANSITLVPGTMTLEMEADEITIHAFTPDAADDLASAAMQNRVARVFGDGPQTPPELVWDSGYTGRGFTIVHTPVDVESDLDEEGSA